MEKPPAYSPQREIRLRRHQAQCLRDRAEQLRTAADKAACDLEEAAKREDAIVNHVERLCMKKD